MGLMNTRAICPGCGGKIHTQANGLGAMTWARSGPLTKTGTTCQHCGIQLTGKVGWDGYARRPDDPAGTIAMKIALAEASGDRAAERIAERSAATRADADALLALIPADEPLLLRAAKQQLGLNTFRAAAALASLQKRKLAKAHGVGKRRILERVTD